jgi:hypothetical protein
MLTNNIMWSKRASKVAATTVWSAVKDINLEHQIVEKTKDRAVSTAQ